jgi:virginiamycin A acetyltransferase
MIIKHLKNWVFNEVYQLLRFGNYIPDTSKVSIHNTAKVYGSRLDGEISISEGCLIARCELYGNISLGRYTSLNGPNLDIYTGTEKVIVGNFCSIARNVSFQGNNHITTRATTYPIFKNIFKEDNNGEFVSKGSIEVGSDVWIGSHSVILSGTKIHHGAVIAANSVVAGEIPPYAIAGGSPAKVIRYRFSRETVEKLLNSQWWEWDMERIHTNKSFFSQDL